MKLRNTFCLFLLVACGAYENKGGSGAEARLGALVSIGDDAVLPSNEKNILSKICSAFNTHNSLAGSLFLGKTWEYNGSNQTCAGAPVATGVANLKLKTTGGLKTFEKISGPSNDYFEDFQSDQQGFLANLCNQNMSGDIARTYPIGSNLYTQFYFYSGEELCDGDMHMYCFDVDYAVKNSAGQFIKEYSNRLKVLVDADNINNRHGMVVRRELLDRCANGVNSEGDPIYSFTKQQSDFVQHN
ncbi:MAG: hypothetical protein JNM93_05660 [Bacteriovoracaceae bacterium]|nr:hypothetical protein [Bacteriovoracaceae bacterium]